MPRSVATTKTPPRAWQRMLSGRRLDLLDPSPLDIEIEDIAHGLSRVARWNGQTSGDWAYSVAQHSVHVVALVEDLLPDASRQDKLYALVHDAPEYVLGDLITPFKSAIASDYKRLENRLLEAVHLRFGLPALPPPSLAAVIKQADRQAAHMEAVDLAGFEPAEARRLFGPAPAPWSRIQAIPPDQAKQAFLARFARLFRP